jgi:sulfate transport system ATP-binding protein
VEIEVVGVHKEFGATPALHDVSVRVGEGELMALLGPSGSGKTTLLRVIAGLEIAERGRILFGGRDATALPVQQRRVGFVFQHYALFRHLSVFDNIAYGLRARPRRQRPTPAAMRARVLELLDLVQLSGLERRYPAQLSGGQRQRVALVRALAIEPQVLLLDEPFGALDAKVRKDLRRWLRDIHERSGQTTVFVTHDQDEALELADRVAILHRGRLEQVGTPDDVYDAPASAFVMSFVGESSPLPVRIGEGHVWFGERCLRAVAAPDLPAGAGTLYVRPADVVLVREATDALPGVVRAARRVGDVRRVDVVLEDGSVLELDTDVEARLAAGDTVALQLRGGHIFPPRD